MKLNELIRSVLTQKRTITKELKVSFVYATKVNGKFDQLSEAVIISISEEEAAWKIDRISQKYCAGYNYFLELDLLREMGNPKGLKEDQQNEVINRIIRYANNDS